MASSPLASPSEAKVADVIERLGFGWTHLKEVILGAGVWLADGSAILLIGSVTHAVALEWGLAHWKKGCIVSTIFVGVLFGNFISGPGSDSFGRRPPIIISYIGVAICMLCGAFANSFEALSAVSLMFGVSYGIGQPAWNALCTEITPSNRRSMMSIGSQSLFVVGELYAAVLVWMDDPTMQHLQWRWLMVKGSIPACICGVLSICLLNESPSWLAIHGRNQEAKGVLESMRYWNRKYGVSVDFQPCEVLVSENRGEAIRQQLGVVFGRVMFFSTVVTCFSCFTLNFMLHGSLYAFPQVLPEVDLGSSAAAGLIIGAIWELPGYALALLGGSFLDRRPAQVAYLAAIVPSIGLFVYGGLLKHPFFLQIGYAGMKCFINMAGVAIYQYTSELYPTSARVAGTAVCFALGRLGSIVAPLVFENLWALTSSWASFFYVMLSLTVFNVVLVCFLPFETRNRSLKDHVEDIGVEDPLVACLERPQGKSNV